MLSLSVLLSEGFVMFIVVRSGFRLLNEKLNHQKSSYP